MNANHGSICGAKEALLARDNRHISMRKKQLQGYLKFICRAVMYMK